METNTRQIRKFRLYGDYRKKTLGKEDIWKYYNPLTGRPIKHVTDYNKVILYGENTRVGYHSMALLEKKDNEVNILNEVFDQEGASSFNDMWMCLMQDVRL